MSIPTIKLNNGKKMPQIGLGTWLCSEEEGRNATIAAIKNGYRHIDTAMIYGNEIQVGEGIKECIPSIVKREDLFITTKLWLYDFDDVEVALQNSLKRMGLQYIDLYLVHWPIKQVLQGEKRDPNDYVGWCKGFSPPLDTLPNYSIEWFLPVWRALEKCVTKGLVRSIGLSNFNMKRIDELLKVCKIKPAMNQIEIHPGLSQQELIDYCHTQNITVTAYSPVGNPGRPDEFRGVNSMNPLENPTILSIARKYNKTPAQIILRWGIDRHYVIIPKSVHENRIKENINIFDFKLTNDEINEIKKLDCGYRICTGDNFYSDENALRELFE